MAEHEEHNRQGRIPPLDESLIINTRLIAIEREQAEEKKRDAEYKHRQLRFNMLTVVFTGGLLVANIIYDAITLRLAHTASVSATAAQSAANTASGTLAALKSSGEDTKQQVERLITQQQRTADSMERSVDRSKEAMNMGERQSRSGLEATVHNFRQQQRAWIAPKGAVLREDIAVALVAASCVATGQHPVADVAGGLVTVWLVARGPALWQEVRQQGERIANSWHEWRIGPVRVINHGIYAGTGAALALWIAVTLVGPGRRLPVIVAALASIVMAALWAQYVEGLSQLLRPFGFYGGLLGGTAGALLAPFFGVSAWLVLAAFAAAGPWAQAMGRLRCLVQGCCHGRPGPDSIGIRYTHPRSRVCRMTQWTGVPLHPTPIYSILCNAFIALVITRLWFLHAPLHLIAGLYFILTGLGRFVEEAWRGEPQTPVFAGLRLYQWAAVASVSAGALMTSLGPSDPAPAAHFDWSTLLPSAAFGVLVCCAMGVDFPESSRRFSRLA